MVDRDEIIFKLGQLESKVDGIRSSQESILTAAEKIKEKVTSLEGFRVGAQITSAIIAIVISAAATLLSGKV